jgi:dolichol kinase
LFLAVRDLRKHHPGKDFSQILSIGDPITLAVIYEDSVAVFGVFVAALGIIVSSITGK